MVFNFTSVLSPSVSKIWMLMTVPPQSGVMHVSSRKSWCTGEKRKTREFISHTYCDIIILKDSAS